MTLSPQSSALSPEVLNPDLSDNRPLFLRNEKVLLDRDLAALYGVSTKVLNQAVKRNARRFPPDFMFRLTKKEKDELVTNCDRFKPLKHSAVSPRAFTEQGVAMLSSVVNSHRAIEVNIAIMRAFVHLRKMIASQTELAKKLKELEHHIKDHDEKIQKIITIQPINYLTNRPALL